MHFLKKVKSQPKNTLAVQKVAAKTWMTRLWWKRCEIKRGWPRPVHAGMLLITLKILIMTHAGCKTFFQVTKHWGKKNVLQPGSYYQKLIPACTGTPFWFHTFSSQPCSGLGRNFFTARVFLVGIIIGASLSEPHTSELPTHFSCSRPCAKNYRKLTSTSIAICFVSSTMPQWNKLTA